MISKALNIHLFKIKIHPSVWKTQKSSEFSLCMAKTNLQSQDFEMLRKNRLRVPSLAHFLGFLGLFEILAKKWQDLVVMNRQQTLIQ